ncbi:hypothetical protein [Bradyrhizobium sp. CCBAU 11361]|uniref:hypothetical protein n=1 Tax=Bradyrhizobium sp. CCBAU 11361 TaxID=1630812 RepID=UPI0023030B3B|nr:hypothetical protein [Bradyrhizobium sp. CCBAU 11361]MDA9489363.1 hypothetical protein [Bradyrhizobium sp. CCBAU 11361]
MTLLPELVPAIDRRALAIMGNTMPARYPDDDEEDDDEEEDEEEEDEEEEDEEEEDEEEDKTDEPPVVREPDDD